MPTEALEQPIDELRCHACFSPLPRQIRAGADFKLPYNVREQPHTAVHPSQATGEFLSCLITCLTHELKALPELRQVDTATRGLLVSSDDAP
jgi:hypothetical protein